MLPVERSRCIFAAHCNNPTGTTGVLTDPIGEVVNLAVDDGPTIGRAVVSFDRFESYRFGGVGSGIYRRRCH